MLLLALALPAHAVDYSIQDHLPTLGVKADKLYANPGSVTLDGVVELPIYEDGSPTTRGPLVELELPDGTKQLVALGLGDSHITLSEGTVTALGGEKKERVLKKDGGTIEVATVDFALGGAQFTDVLVRVGPNDQLGLLAFEGLSIGVFPSEGVVRLANSGELSIEGGTRLDYTRIEATSHKDGTRRWQNPALSTLVTGTWNDQPATIRLMFQNENNQVAGNLLEGQDAVFQKGAVGTYAGSVELTGLEPISARFEQTDSTAYTRLPFDVTLGPRVTSGWDVVFDGQGTLSIKVADEVVRNSWADTELEQALEGLEKPEDADDDWTVPASAHTALASVYAKQGRYDEALEQAEKAFAATEEPSCSDHTNLAGYQLVVGDYETARTSLADGIALYDVWGDIPAKDRVAILEEKAKVEEGVKLFGVIPVKKPGTWEGEVVQPHSCDASRADLLWVEAALGNWDEVERIWTEDRDVDATLGHAAMSAFIAQERWDEAFGALSWSVSNGTTDYHEAWVPLAYAVIQDQQGKADQAWSNYERALGLAGDTELLTFRAYAAAYTARNDRAAAATHMAEVAAGSTSPHAALVAAETLQASGQDAAQAFADADAAYRAALRVDPDQSSWHAGLSSVLLRTGDLEGAKASAQAALAANPLDALAHLAMGDVLVMSGDDAASDHYRQAAVIGSDNPLLATML